MKKLMLFVCATIIATISYAQRVSDFGGFVGAAYYMGDLNKTKLFYSPSLVYGGSYRHTFNQRYALKMSILNAHLSGSDKDFSDPYQQFRSHDFKSNITDISMKLEFSFFPYDPQDMAYPISPYVSAGVAMVVAPGATTTLSNVGIPFGIGVKFNITERFSAGVEWAFRKTFTDYLDKLDLATTYTNASSLSRQRYEKENYDWYSFCGVYLMMRIFEVNYKCPAYRSYQ